MPQRLWPEEIRAAIAREVVRGSLTTGQILQGIRNGKLEGLSRAYDYPTRTFYLSLRVCRERLSALGVIPPEPEPQLDTAESVNADMTLREERIGRTIQHLESLVGAEG